MRGDALRFVHPQTLTLVVVTLLTATPFARTAAGHVGTEEGFSPSGGFDAVAETLSLASVLLVALVASLAMARSVAVGRGPDRTWVLLAAGVAWVTLAVWVPASWIYAPWWTAAGTIIVLGFVGTAWWVAAPSLRRLVDARPLGGAARFVPLFAGVATAVLFGFGTHIVLVPTAAERAFAESDGFVILYEAFGPLVVWPAVEFWWPAATLTGHLTPANVAIALTLGVFVTAGVRGMLAARRASGVAGFGGVGGVALATNMCACCTPVLFPVLVALLGAAAAPVAYAMSDPDLGLHNAIQVLDVWLVVWAVRSVVPVGVYGAPQRTSPGQADPAS